MGVAWKESEIKEGLARIPRVLEETSGWCFQAKHVEGVKYTFANGITNMENNDQQKKYLVCSSRRACRRHVVAQRSREES